MKLPCASAALFVASSTLFAASGQVPVASGFTYQGRIKQGGFLVEGTADIRLSLWTHPTAGFQVGPIAEFQAVPVTKGVFAVAPDFGLASFTGDARWIQVEVRAPAGGQGGFTVVSPRQQLATAPYALHAQNGSEWDRVGAGIVFNEGSVGVGTGSPGAKLDVAGGSIRTTGTLISAAPQGTPALEVSSSALVPNLNAALLGGVASSEFGRISGGQSWTAPNVFSSVGNAFTGNGSGLVGVDAATLSGTSSTGIGRIGTSGAPIPYLQRWYGDHRWDGPCIFASTSNTFRGSGAGIRWINAAMFQSGTVPNARTTGTASATVQTLALRDANGSFGANTITSSSLGVDGVSNSHLQIRRLGGSGRSFRFQVTPSNELELFDQTAGATRFLVRATGEVGIGTIAPTATLHVAGAGRFDGNLTVAGCTGCDSDLRLKTDIEPLAGSLEAVLRLRPVRYRWREESPAARSGNLRPQVGFIAQEVRELIPEAVIEQSEGTLALDYGRLTTILAGAIGEILERMRIHAENQDRLLSEQALVAEQGLNEQQWRDLEILHAQLAELEQELVIRASRW